MVQKLDSPEDRGWSLISSYQSSKLVVSLTIMARMTETMKTVYNVYMFLCTTRVILHFSERDKDISPP